MNEIKITHRQKEIMILLYRFRFLDRAQIQKFLGHKDPRRIKAWLKDLTDKSLTGRHFSKSLKDNTPAVYFLATKAKKTLQDTQEIDENLLKRVYREKMRSNRFIEHSMLLADIYLFLKNWCTKDKTTLHFYTKTDLSTHNYFPYQKPDSYIAIENKRKIKRYFLEIIDEGTPRYIIRSRISQYIDYFYEGEWQKVTGHPDPFVLIVCPNAHIQRFLFKHILKVLEEEAEEVAFYLTTKQEVLDSKLERNVWKSVEYEEDLPAI